MLRTILLALTLGFAASVALAQTAQTPLPQPKPVKRGVASFWTSPDRLYGMNFTFGQRYVVVNIPAAVAEAVEDGKVARRYVTVVGKVDRPSPTLTTTITAVNLNPTWTVPLSILKKDIVTKMRKDGNYIARMNMRVLDGSGNEID